MNQLGTSRSWRWISWE